MYTRCVRSGGFYLIFTIHWPQLLYGILMIKRSPVKFTNLCFSHVTYLKLPPSYFQRKWLDDHISSLFKFMLSQIIFFSLFNMETYLITPTCLLFYHRSLVCIFCDFLTYINDNPDYFPLLSLYFELVSTKCHAFHSNKSENILKMKDKILMYF